MEMFIMIKEKCLSTKNSQLSGWFRVLHIYLLQPNVVLIDQMWQAAYTVIALYEI